MKIFISLVLLVQSCVLQNRVENRIQKICGTTDFEIKISNTEDSIQKKIYLLKDQIRKYEELLQQIEEQESTNDFLDYKKNIQERISNIYEVVQQLPEKKGDEKYSNLKFLEALEYYLLSESTLENITPFSKRKSIQDRLNFKKKILIQSAEKEVYLKIKNYISDANYYWIQDRKAQANRLVSLAESEMDETMFLSDDTIEIYNDFVVGILKRNEYISKKCKN